MLRDSRLHVMAPEKETEPRRALLKKKPSSRYRLRRPSSGIPGRRKFSPAWPAFQLVCRLNFSRTRRLAPNPTSRRDHSDLLRFHFFDQSEIRIELIAERAAHQHADYSIPPIADKLRTSP
jgi:hypothetical protein